MLRLRQVVILDLSWLAPWLWPCSASEFGFVPIAPGRAWLYVSLWFRLPEKAVPPPETLPVKVLVVWVSTPSRLPSRCHSQLNSCGARINQNPDGCYSSSGFLPPFPLFYPALGHVIIHNSPIGMGHEHHQC